MRYRWVTGDILYAVENDEGESEVRLGDPDSVEAFAYVATVYGAQPFTAENIVHALGTTFGLERVDK